MRIVEGSKKRQMGYTICQLTRYTVRFSTQTFPPSVSILPRPFLIVFIIDFLRFVAYSGCALFGGSKKRQMGYTIKFSTQDSVKFSTLHTLKFSTQIFPPSVSILPRPFPIVFIIDFLRFVAYSGCALFGGSKKRQMGYAIKFSTQ